MNTDDAFRATVNQTLLADIAAAVSNSEAGEALAALLYAAADNVRGTPSTQWRQVWFAKSELRAARERPNVLGFLFAEVLWHEDEGIAKLVIEVAPDWNNTLALFANLEIGTLIPLPRIIRAQVCPTYVHAIEWGQKTYKTQVVRFRQLTVLEKS